MCAYSSSGSQQVCGLCEESGGVLGCAGGHAVVDNRSGACVRCDVVTVLSSHADIRCVIWCVVVLCVVSPCYAFALAHCEVI